MYMYICICISVYIVDHSSAHRWKAAVDTILKDDFPSLTKVLDASLHLIPDEVLDAPPRAGPCAEAASHGVTSAAAPQPVSTAVCVTVCVCARVCVHVCVCACVWLTVHSRFLDGS